LIRFVFARCDKRENEPGHKEQCYFRGSHFSL
jgi:hypothetical protein